MTNTLELTVEQTYNDLFKQNSKALCNFLYYRYGDLEKAKDIVQESFVKLWNMRSTVPAVKGKNLLYAMAKNMYLNDIKHQKVIHRYQQEGAGKEGSCQEAPDFILEGKEFEAKLKRAIAGLSEKERTVFLLNRIEKVTYNEIAIQEKITVKAVEKRMSNALKKIRTNIEGL